MHSLDTAWSRWLSVWTLLSLPGASLAVLTWGTVDVLGLALLSAVLVVVVQLASTATTVSSPDTVSVCGRTALGAGMASAALAGLGSAWPAAALAAMLVAGATTPAVIGWVRASGRRQHDRDVAPAPSAPSVPVRRAVPAHPLSLLTDAQLCRAWRQSFVELQDARTDIERLCLVEARQACLDEIEMRDARALQAWLASGARAAGGPDRFMRNGDRRPPDAP